MASEYVFRPMARADLPLIRRWLALPHVRQWWGDPQEQFALVSSDLAEPAMDQYIVGADGSGFAYLQCYCPKHVERGIRRQPAGTRGIGLFIGEVAILGGHGSTLIRRFVSEQLGGGVPRIVTDPDPANVRAIRAYEPGL